VKWGHNKDVIETFEYLFPKMNDGGCYIVEDFMYKLLEEITVGFEKQWRRVSLPK
jgi:hypothetical protein